jgi:hypothetical protein
MLDADGLRHAIRCGVLQMAMDVLASNENDAKVGQDQGQVVISIWASLIQNDQAIKCLSAPVLKADYISEAREIKLFLQHLRSGLQHSNGPSSVGSASITPAASASDSKQIVQCAAILSTIISTIPAREAPVLLQVMLELSLLMLEHVVPLVQEWGCLLIGQLLKNLKLGNQAQIQALVRDAKEALIGLVTDRRVETRAAALDALRCWLRSTNMGTDGKGSASASESKCGVKGDLKLLEAILPRIEAEAAVQTRLQLANLLCTALGSRRTLSRLAVATVRAQEIVKLQPELTARVVAISGGLSRAFKMDDECFAELTLLMQAFNAVRLYSLDSHAQVAARARGIMRDLQYDQVQEHGGKMDADLAWLERYSQEILNMLQHDGDAPRPAQTVPESSLFKHSKDLLRAYLPVRPHTILVPSTTVTLGTWHLRTDMLTGQHHPIRPQDPPARRQRPIPDRADAASPARGRHHGRRAANGPAVEVAHGRFLAR